MQPSANDVADWSDVSRGAVEMVGGSGRRMDEGMDAWEEATADAGRRRLAAARERRCLIGLSLALLIVLLLAAVVGFVLPDQGKPTAAVDLLILAEFFAQAMQ